VAFTPNAGQTIKLSTSDTVNTPSYADHEVAISECPGDFAPTYPCEYQSIYVGSTMTTYGGTSGPVYACKLKPGTTYYMNVRQVVKGNTSLPSCPSGPTGAPPGACEVRTQIQF
jgi:hypothetical protein